MVSCNYIMSTMKGGCLTISDIVRQQKNDEYEGAVSEPWNIRAGI